MNRLRSLVHSARFLLVVLPIAGVSIAVAVGCSQAGVEEADDSYGGLTEHSGYGGYGSSGYGGWSGYGNNGYGH